MTARMRALVLRTSGILLCALGVLHLAVTPFIARMIAGGALPSAVESLIVAALAFGALLAVERRRGAGAMLPQALVGSRASA